MSAYTDLVNAVISNKKATMEELLANSNKAFESLKYADMGAYNEVMAELENMYYCIDEEQARSIVRAMRPYGENWSYETIKEYITSKGETAVTDYYLLMNMARNDYYETARSVDADDDANFYYMIAHDFINDADAKPHKVAKYFMQ